MALEWAVYGVGLCVRGLNVVGARWSPKNAAIALAADDFPARELPSGNGEPLGLLHLLPVVRSAVSKNEPLDFAASGRGSSMRRHGAQSGGLLFSRLTSAVATCREKEVTSRASLALLSRTAEALRLHAFRAHALPPQVFYCCPVLAGEAIPPSASEGLASSLTTGPTASSAEVAPVSSGHWPAAQGVLFNLYVPCLQASVLLGLRGAALVCTLPVEDDDLQDL